MQDFSKKKYTKVEVQKIIEQLRIEYDARLKQQKTRIFELVNQNSALQAQLDNVQNLELTNQAQKLQKIAKNCQSYFLAIKDKYPNTSELKDFFEVAHLVESAANVHLGDKLQNAQSEKEQINTQVNAEIAAANVVGFDPKQKINNYINNNSTQSTFNLDDVINPKYELNLEELCKELGLM